MIEASLRTFILRIPGVAAALGTGAAARVYPVKLPQAPALPAMTYLRISGDRGRTTDGPNGYGFARIQLDLWGDDYAALKALSRTIRNVLDGHHGLMGAAIVQDTVLENDRDSYEDSVKLFTVGVDVVLTFDEGGETS